MTLDWTWEERAGGLVAGVDEAGRGPWAGPVVAAAVILQLGKCPPGVNDSKQLAEPVRERLHDDLCAQVIFGIGSASVAEIDALNIHWATMLAMERAVAALGRAVDHVLVDGNRLPRWQHAATAIVEGDARCHSIAAASIIAKVTRDRLMRGLDAECPGYGWARNKGYGTPDHARSLAALGATIHHRRSFAPVRAVLAPASQSCG
ncbi:ribonuclease HII [alpha proteobacterium AAP81b]|nr:ribonuclease HII [alpha proteobacterium AAP81b]